MVPLRVDGVNLHDCERIRRTCLPCRSRKAWRRTIYGSKSFDRNAIESDKYNDDVIVVGNTLVTTMITKG